MAYVTIKFDEVLYVTKADIPGMYSIGHCLTDDVGFAEGQRRIDWILDARYKTACSNRTCMEKNNGMIAVGDLFTDDPCEAALIVPIPVLIDLLQQWDEVCKTNPEEVTIYYENEKFRIEAKEQNIGNT
ncbi:hypothetical protein JST99_01070 [Candidatus Dependentiae bacterium]|nr:hypothetical protein [Candidatus Dependentiae bacterium]